MILLGNGFINAHKLAEKKGGPPRILVSSEVCQWCEKLIPKLWPNPPIFYNGDILRHDSDGYCYLNYLAFWRVPFEENLNNIREIIIKKLKENVNYPCIYPKYDWFTRYFNAYVNKVNTGGDVYVKPIKMPSEHKNDSDRRFLCYNQKESK